MHDLIRRLTPSIAATSVVLAAVAAHAQSANVGTPEALFAEGDRLSKAGKLAEACEQFEASQRAGASAGTLIRIGDCREKLHQLASAYNAYKAALARAKDPQKRQIAQAKVAELEPMLSHLTVTSNVPFTITHDGHPVEQGAVDGGDYTVSAGSWTKTVSVPGSVGVVRVEVPAPAPVPAPPPTVPPPAVAARAAAEHPPAEQPLVVAHNEPARSSSHTALWIGIGTAVLAGSAAAIYWKTRPGESCTGNCIDLRK